MKLLDFLRLCPASNGEIPKIWYPANVVNGLLALGNKNVTYCLTVDFGEPGG
jgi:hypothetical protein